MQRSPTASHLKCHSYWCENIWSKASSWQFVVFSVTSPWLLCPLEELHCCFKWEHKRVFEIIFAAKFSIWTSRLVYGRALHRDVCSSASSAGKLSLPEVCFLAKNSTSLQLHQMSSCGNCCNCPHFDEMSFDTTWNTGRGSGSHSRVL